MAHYAILDENNIVVQVIVGKNEYDMLNGMLIDWEAYYGGKRTSYHGNIRKNFAGIGYTYDSSYVIDGVVGVFYAPQPYPSWTLNTSTFLWEAPVPYPTDGGLYEWDEATLSWVLVPTS